MWAVCDYCDITKVPSYLRLTTDGEIRCAECLKLHDTWQDDRIEELTEYNRRVTRERDKLLTLKWGLQWGEEIDLGEITEIMDRINAVRITDLDILLRLAELNGLFRELADATREA